MIKLYESTETSFKSNGLGGLTDALTCKVIEELNGKFELEMTYPVDGAHFSEIKKRRIIFTKPNPHDNAQAFRIYAISKPINCVVTVYAEHISYDLSGIPVMPTPPYYTTTLGKTMDFLKANATVTCPFYFFSDFDETKDLEMRVPKSIRSCLGTDENGILSVYGGEYEFDMYNVRLHKHRGANRGFVINYGKNMIDMTQEENCENVYTHILPYYYREDDGYQYLDEKTVAVEGTFDYTKILTVDLTSEFDEMPTQAVLKAKAQEYAKLNKIGIPKVSLTVSFIPIHQGTELVSLDEVRLGDTVTVKFVKLGVKSNSECVSTEYDAISEKYVSVVLGEPIDTISDTVSNTVKDLYNETDRATTAEAQLQSTITKTAEAIRLEVTRASTAEGQLQASINVTADAITAEVSRASTAEGQLQASINVTADAITAEVSRASSAEGTLQSNINVTAGNISTEVTRATGVESSLSSRIDQNASDITLRVTSGDVSSQIYIALNNLVLTSSQIRLEGYTSINGGFVVDTSGKVKLTNSSIINTTTYGSDVITLSMSDVSFGISLNQNGVNTASMGIDHSKISFYSNTKEVSYGRNELTFGNVSSVPIFHVDYSGVEANGYTVLTAGNYGSYITGYAASNHTHSGYASSSHSHNTLEISVVTTDSDNIDFPGSINGASVTYVQREFERKGSSDFRLKKDIQSLPDISDLYMSLKPKMYRFKDSKVDNDLHFGLIAQELESALTKHGFPSDCNIVQQYATRSYMDEGMYTGETAYRIQYNELNALHIAMVQALYSKVNQLEEEICKIRKTVM